MKKGNGEFALYVKVFLILAVLGIVMPKILQLASDFFSIYDKKPDNGNCVYVIFNYGIKKNVFNIYNIFKMYIFSK